MSSYETYDTPPDSEVLQADEPDLPTVKVETEGVGLVQNAPCETFYRNWLMPTGQVEAEKILNADPRRKSVKLWWFGLGNGITGICIANNKGDAQDGRGAFLVNGTFTSATYPFDCRNELWARAILINNSGGTFSAFAVTTDDAFLNAGIEQWAR